MKTELEFISSKYTRGAYIIQVSKGKNKKYIISTNSITKKIKYTDNPLEAYRFSSDYEGYNAITDNIKSLKNTFNIDGKIVNLTYSVTVNEKVKDMMVYS